MNIDANTPERDEFDGDPLNPKHIEAVCGYLRNSPRDNLKVQALEIIESQQKAIKGKSTQIMHQDEVIDDLIDRRDWYKNQYDRVVESNGSLVRQIEGIEKELTMTVFDRIVLWFKKGK